MEKKQMDGGQFSLGIIKRKLLGKTSMGDVVRRTKKSEMSLINAYEVYDDKTKKYNKAYSEHLNNLKALDDYVNFKGMETLFTKIIMKDNFKTGHIDRSNPLLFKNYLVESDVPPSTLRKEHILQQVRYILNKYFPSREHLFIKYMDVEVGKSAFNLNIITIDNNKKIRKINHDDYIINKNETKKALNEVISSAKKNLKRESLVVEYNNSSRSKRSGVSSFKSKDKSNYKSKNTKKTTTKRYKRTSETNKKYTNKATAKVTHKSFNKILEGMLELDLNDSKSNKSKSDKKKKNSLPDLKSKSEPKQEKLSMYMTTSEKEAKKEKEKPKAPQSPPGPVFEPGFRSQPGDFGLIAQTQGILAGSVPPITQPLGPSDPEDQRCNQYSGHYDTCKTQGCLFSQGQCIKKVPRPQLFGVPPPEQQNQQIQQIQQNPYGASPQGQSPFVTPAPLNQFPPLPKQF
jgi:hypothetical protein